MRFGGSLLRHVHLKSSVYSSLYLGRASVVPPEVLEIVVKVVQFNGRLAIGK